MMPSKPSSGTGIRFLGRALYYLATGYILYFWSERAFWSRWQPTDSLPDALATVFAFSLLAFLFLQAVWFFRARTVYAVFLAGCVFGWLGEGIVVSTMYDDFPYNIIWTGVAWHALLTVMVGWRLFRHAYSEGNATRLILLSAAAGFVWATWALFWAEEDGFITPPADFARHAFGFGAFLIIAYWVTHSIPARCLRPGLPDRVLTVLLLLFAVYLFLTQVAPAKPLAPCVLPPVLGGVLLVLWRNRQTETPEMNAVAASPGRPRFSAPFLLLVFPATASVAYAVYRHLGVQIPSNIILYVVSYIVGFAMLVLSVVRTLSRRLVSAATPTSRPPSADSSPNR